MKIILSRKGFDSQNGGIPSPILPDGTLLTLPIPSKSSPTIYTDLHHEGRNYYEIIKDLHPSTKVREKWTCHLDPDLVEEVTNRQGTWHPALGQCDQSESHLKAQGVGIGDVFLFWGWFRQTEKLEGHLRFVKGAPDLHVIFGYLAILEKFAKGIPDRYSYHPHASPAFSAKKKNCLYLSDSKSSGTFKFDRNLILTKEGETRSKWALPECFRGLSITYHSDESWKDSYFESAKKGQEFVVEESAAVTKWFLSLLQDQRGK